MNLPPEDEQLLEELCQQHDVSVLKVLRLPTRRFIGVMTNRESIGWFGDSTQPYCLEQIKRI